MRLRPLAATTLIVVTLALGGCGGSSSGGAGSAGGGSSTTEAPSSGGGAGGSGGSGDAVTIADFAFDPVETEIEVGDTVTFTNEDEAEHTATADEGDPTSFDTGKLTNGDSKDITFDEAGEYAYYCSIHEYMKGTIRVVE